MHCCAVCQKQGSQAYQTLQESWPGYGACTYMVGESSEATVKVICSPCPRIIGKIFQNQGDTGMYIITMADLGLTPQIAQQIGTNRSEESKTIAD